MAKGRLHWVVGEIIGSRFETLNQQEYGNLSTWSKMKLLKDQKKKGPAQNGALILLDKLQ